MSAVGVVDGFGLSTPAEKRKKVEMDKASASKLVKSTEELDQKWSEPV